MAQVQRAATERVPRGKSMYQLYIFVAAPTCGVTFRLGDCRAFVKKNRWSTLSGAMRPRSARRVVAVFSEGRSERLHRLDDLSTLWRLVADVCKTDFVSRERPDDEQRSLQAELTRDVVFWFPAL